MTLPTPTKKDIEAAERYGSRFGHDNSWGRSISREGHLAGKMEERALALKRIETMFDEVAHEIADFFGRPCTDSVVYEKIIAIKEKRIRDYKQATGIGDDKDKVFISCEQKRSTEIL